MNGSAKLWPHVFLILFPIVIGPSPRVGTYPWCHCKALPPNWEAAILTFICCGVAFNFKETLNLHHPMAEIISFELRKFKFTRWPQINWSRCICPFLHHCVASGHQFMILDTKPSNQTLEFCYRLAQFVLVSSFRLLYHIYELTVRLLRTCAFHHG